VTLFETLVALVILGVAVVAFLGAFQVTSTSLVDAQEWVQAVGFAEAAMEETKLGTGDQVPESASSGFRRDVSVRPWTASPELQLVTVEVSLPRGGTFTLQRLTRGP
jgi:type II secretory pathway pseudopilin PulG